MKILLIIDSFTIGGAQRQLTLLAKSLANEHDVHMLVYHPNTSYLEEEVRESGIPITKIFKKSKYDIFFLFNFFKFLFKNEFDCSISFLDTPNFYNETGKLLKLVPKIIVSQRSAYFKKDLSFKRKILEYFHGLADVIVTNSISQKTRMGDYFPFLKEKLKYIPNGYDFYHRYNCAISVKENKLFKFIVVSNTLYYKNAYKLCEALVVYQRKYGRPEFKIYWYGQITTRSYDAQCLAEGITLLNENDLSDVLFFEGRSSEIYNRINESDALIHISDFEGCPNSVCEAMLLHKPVILSNVCDHPYLVKDGNGILVDQNDPEDIAGAIFEVYNKNKEDLVDMGRKGYELIESKVNMESVQKTWLELVE